MTNAYSAKFSRVSRPYGKQTKASYTHAWIVYGGPNAFAQGWAGSESAALAAAKRAARGGTVEVVAVTSWDVDALPAAGAAGV